jgi:uncharacterized membrane protein YadS
MFGFANISFESEINLHIDWFIMAFIVVLFFKTTQVLSKKAIYQKRMAVFAGMLFVTSMLLSNHVSKFLYYDF